VNTQLSSACGVLSKLKHYTTQSVVKVVYNSLIHTYYSILKWGRASNATIQPLIKLQNKAIKRINPTNTGSLQEHFQQLNILYLPKLYTLSVGKFMDSHYNKLLPNRFDESFEIFEIFQIVLKIFHSSQLNSLSLHKTSNF